jgi:tetratricopeptide (TPR) repeat protein
MCLLLALVLAVVVVFFARPRLGFLGVWVIVTLAPTSSFVPVGSEVGAERRMYLPLVALVTLAVIGATVALDWFERRSVGTGVAPTARRDFLVETVVLVTLVAILSATTVARNQEYASALTMARTVLARWPSPAAEDMVGTELARVGQHDEAIQHLRLAAPSYPPAFFNLGNELFLAGRFDDAIAQLQTFIQDEPRLSTTASARLLIGRAFEAKQQWPEAIAQFRLALATAPLDPDAQGLLAEALATTQAFGESIGYYQAFLAQRPTDAGAWTGLGIALVATGRAAESSAAFRHAVDLQPQNGQFQANLARTLLDQGHSAEAAGPAQRAVALLPGDPTTLELLGRVLASQGRIDGARRAFQQALRLDPSYEPAREDLRRIGG